MNFPIETGPDGAQIRASSSAERKIPKATIVINLSDLLERGVEQVLGSCPDAGIVRVDHEGAGAAGKNLIHLARKDPGVRAVMVALANHGFMVYMLKGSVTSLVHHERVATLWQRIIDGRFQVDENGLIYTVANPLGEHVARRLLVVFSSMAKDIHMPSMMRHFEQNFASVQKYMPVGTAVLRILDMGGVVGGYYMNTHGFPENERHIQDLISRVMKGLNLSSDDVVLYGGSKGGTAALYHGLLGGFRAVSVDPILADEHYVKVFGDSHFTEGVFPEDKRVKFERMSSDMDPASIKPAAIICSARSPQFPYIDSIIQDPLRSRIAFFNSLHPEIKQHPDVSPKTLNIAVMLMNMMFYRIPVSCGMWVVDDEVGQAHDLPGAQMS